MNKPRVIIHPDQQSVKCYSLKRIERLVTPQMINIEFEVKLK